MFCSVDFVRGEYAAYRMADPKSVLGVFFAGRRRQKVKVSSVIKF